MENENISSPEVANVQEERLETTLRPQTLDEYIGQTKVKESMKIYIEAAKKREMNLLIIVYFMDLQVLEKQQFLE